MEPVEQEQALIAAARQGDRQAFGKLVRCHQAGVVSVVYRMCGDTRLAEDAAQEAFVRAWQNLPAYEARAPFRNWLYRIATNAALDVLRRERPTTELDEVRLAHPGPNPEVALIAQEQATQVQQAIMDLPPASRSVLILREYEGLSYKEIASTLDIPLGTVMSRLNYARTKLGEQLADLVGAQA